MKSMPADPTSSTCLADVSLHSLEPEIGGPALMGRLDEGGDLGGLGGFVFVPSTLISHH